jgi:hypothetical protein
MKSKQHSIAAVATGLLAIISPVLRVSAQTSPDTLAITENSSTSLSALWNGSTSGVSVTRNSSDNWTITLPVSILLGDAEAPGSGAAIPEPEATGILGPWNNVTTAASPSGGPQFINQVSVISDSSTTSGFATPVADGVSTAVGFTATGVPVFLTFDDDGDTTRNPTPDAGSTALLGVLSFLALFGVARLRAGSAPVR